MAYARLLICMMVLLAACRQSNASEEMVTSKFDSVIVKHYEYDAREAQRLADAVSRNLPEIETTLGMSLDDIPEIVACRSSQEFFLYTGDRMPDSVVAVAQSSVNRIVMDLPAINKLSIDALYSTLKHELCHLVIGVAARRIGRPVPRWFNEGVATHLSGKTRFSNYDYLFDAAAMDALIPLENIERSFPSSRRDAELAYLESESFINYLAKRHGEDVFRRVLIRAAEMKDFHVALEDVLGRSLEETERDWIDTLVPRFPWFPRLTVILRNLRLFTVLAVITVIVFAVVKLRRRRQLEYMDEDDYMVP